MGGRVSSPPPLLLETPWRELGWGDKQRSVDSIQNYRVQGRQEIQILLYGPTGAGKSSFINSVNSALRGTICAPALVANQSSDCFTKKYKTYRVPRDEHGDEFYPFVLSDMMGLKVSGRRTRKIHVKDVKRLLKGNVKEGFTFNPECKISKQDRFYNADPSDNHKVHLLAFVIDANTKHMMAGQALETLQDIRDEASDLGIPQVVIFTKVDEFCPEIKKDVRNIYKSIKLQKTMQQFSADVGIPMDCVFAVRNYTDTTVSGDADVILLHVLRHVLSYGGDFRKMMNNNQA